MKAMRAVTLTLAVLTLLAAGCGRIKNAADRAKKSNDLKQLGLMYHNYVDTNHRGPGSADDLKSLASGPQEQAVVQMVKDGKYVLIWGATPSAMPKGASNTVLGYETTTPTGGGLVLMGDASVKTVTAAEFASMPKAEPVNK